MVDSTPYDFPVSAKEYIAELNRMLIHSQMDVGNLAASNMTAYAELEIQFRRMLLALEVKAFECQVKHDKREEVIERGPTTTCDVTRTDKTVLYPSSFTGYLEHKLLTGVLRIASWLYEHTNDPLGVESGMLNWLNARLAGIPMVELATTVQEIHRSTTKTVTEYHTHNTYNKHICPHLVSSADAGHFRFLVQDGVWECSAEEEAVLREIAGKVRELTEISTPDQASVYHAFYELARLGVRYTVAQANYERQARSGISIA